MTTKISMVDIMARNEAAHEAGEVGAYWFDANSFFNSRFPNDYGYEAKDGNIYFVSSEAYNEDAPRLYSVRVLSTDGHINTVGEFQGHPSHGAADSAAFEAATE